MFDWYDEGNRITAVQTMLRYLSFVWSDPSLRVAVNGMESAETESAIRRFQEIAHLPVTGLVDRATWDALTAAYLREERARSPILIRPIPRDIGYATGQAERSDTVLILQIILRALDLWYDFDELPALTGIYDARTAGAVRQFQRINRLPETGDADRETWRRLAEEYNTRVEQ